MKFFIWGARLLFFIALILVAASFVLVHLTRFPTGYWFIDYGVFLIVAFATAPFAMFPTRSEPTSGRRLLLVLSTEAIVFCIALAVYFIVNPHGQANVPIAIVASGTLATLGWITSSFL